MRLVFIYLNWFIRAFFLLYSCLCSAHFPLHLSVGQWAPSVFISKKRETAAMTYFVCFLWDFHIMCFEYKTVIYTYFFGFVNQILIAKIISNYTECIYNYNFICGITTFKFSLGTDAIIAFLACNMTYHFHGILHYNKTLLTSITYLCLP